MKPADKDQRELDSIRSFIEAQDDVKVLLDNSASWADTQAEQSEKSRRTAWRVAAGMGGLAALAIAGAITTTVLSYRPAPPPQILVVDKSTGAVERLVSLADFQETADEATIKRAIATFIRARESYTFDSAEQNYYEAAAFMSPALQAQWSAYWDTNNPQSPLAVYKRDTKVRVELGAISINRDAKGKATSARVSFTKTIKQNDVIVGGERAWLATIAFGFVNVPTQEKSRRINDLGFQVTDYQVDADIAAGASPAALAAPVRPSPAPAAPMTAPALQAPQMPANGISR
jgi:type IV secretion system protein VirB8